MWKKKQSSFASAIGLCFFYLPNFFLANVGRWAKLVCLFGSAAAACREKKFVKVFFFKVGQRARLVCLPASVESVFEEKVHSQSALVHKLMRSGFFICQIFGEGRGVRNVTTGTSHQA